MSRLKTRGSRPEDTNPMAGHGLAHNNTDEGRDKQTAAAKEKGTYSESIVSVGDGPYEKMIQKGNDIPEGKSDSAEPWEMVNPQQELADKHVPEGHRPHFLSERVVDRKGTRGWQPCIGENGDPVKLGGMTLASMPIEKAEKRNKHFRDIGNAAVAEVKDQVAETLARTVSDAPGVSIVNPGEDSTPARGVIDGSR